MIMRVRRRRKGRSSRSHRNRPERRTCRLPDFQSDDDDVSEYAQAPTFNGRRVCRIINNTHSASSRLHRQRRIFQNSGEEVLDAADHWTRTIGENDEVSLRKPNENPESAEQKTGSVLRIHRPYANEKESNAYTRSSCNSPRRPSPICFFSRSPSRWRNQVLSI